MSQQPKFSVAIKSDAYTRLINDTLGNPTVAKKFIADITSVVSQNKLLQQCDAGSIVSAGLMAQSLGLPMASSLGFCYLVPYNNKNGGKLAQFQVGWKGIVQLAIRSGQYSKIGVRPVHEGEALGLDEFGDEIVRFDHKYDLGKIVGYFAYIELVGGFKKTLYWTVEQCQDHAKKYSKSYGTGKETDNWTNMFDTMAQKTVLKQLISKYGIMSVDIIKAIESDQAVIGKDGKLSYVDNADYEEEPARRTNVTNSIIDAVEVDDNGEIVEETEE